jgi:esterase/lipase superfamily enzyme
VLPFANAKARQGRIAIKWIAATVIGSAGVVSVSTYTNHEKSGSAPQVVEMAAPTLAPPAPNELQPDSATEVAPSLQGEVGSWAREEAEGSSKQLFLNPPASPSKKAAISEPRDLAAVAEPENAWAVQDLAVGGSGAAPAQVREGLDESGRKWVRVYFATDRARLDFNGYWIYTRLWLPVFMGVMVASILVIGIAVGVRRWIAITGTSVALAMTAYFSHQAILGTHYIRLLSQSSHVAFGTTRQAEKTGGYPLHLGVSEVTIPPNHRPGELERPSLLRLEWKENDLKHVSLQRVEVLSVDNFFADLKAKGKDSALVFIHGFNVKFDDALRRTAQLTSDLDYRGIPVLYSWPSKGKTLSYTRDEANVGWTVPHLEEFLVDLKNRGNLEHIHVVAHSMGNRALLGVVERLGLRGGLDKPLLSRVVMAAPDVDSLEFQNRFSTLLRRVATATVVYGSRNDRALQLSESIHGHGRLGLVSDHFGSQENVDMIDTSPLDWSMLGHSYYGDSPLVMDDIKAFLSAQFSAHSRPWLQMETGASPSRIVWRFVATAASGISNVK